MTTVYYVRYVVSSSELLRAVDKVLADSRLEANNTFILEQRHGIVSPRGSTKLQYVKLLPTKEPGSSSSTGSIVAVAVRYNIPAENFKESFRLPESNVGKNTFCSIDCSIL
jgi:hypothetical protein